MVFTPPKLTGLLVGLLLGLVVAGTDFGLLAFLSFAPVSLLTFLAICLLVASLPALIWVGYRCYGLARARYVFSRNALLVEWGERRELIPMHLIGEVRQGADMAEDLRPRGLTWPGWAAGRATVAPLGAVEFFASTPKTGLVLINAGDRWLALSPANFADFLAAFLEAKRLGPEEQLEPERVAPLMENWVIWHDRLALIFIAVGGLGVLLLAGYISLIFPQLLEMPAIALHFNAQGQADRFGSPDGLFILPIIAGLAWALNTLLGLIFYRRESERPAAYLLFSVSVFVMVLTWVAAIGLLTAGG